ncbi:hypothetical protein DPMN_106816 [Dreissena polymorpha]|uniref:Reverse transcriptase n=1 Tax=Dreissena polymorpha TaxID=45954 RepID=A0A9D4QK72_DREPO|nr:hypothetical protein DPMN_106816 [Dreissena polymorpha]
MLSKGEIVQGADRNHAHHSGKIPGVEFAVNVNFIDYERAFDRVELQKLLRHYGVPGKITKTIRKSNEGMT